MAHGPSHTYASTCSMGPGSKRGPGIGAMTVVTSGRVRLWLNQMPGPPMSLSDYVSLRSQFVLIRFFCKSKDEERTKRQDTTLKQFRRRGTPRRILNCTHMHHQRVSSTLSKGIHVKFTRIRCAPSSTATSAISCFAEYISSPACGALGLRPGFDAIVSVVALTPWPAPEPLTATTGWLKQTLQTLSNMQ